MDIDETPPWTKSQLRKLGEALLDKRSPPDGCPDYQDVMLWHHELAGELAAIASATPWVNKPAAQFAVTARSKTVDTLVQKLQRSTYKLDRIQDLAGVRIDGELNLTAQSGLAAEIVTQFGAERATIRDLRVNPHSGYRAVHVWLVLPAGRVEVQIRTIYQSLWANVYEGLADLVGRGIRYDEPHSDPVVQQIVDRMHSMSAEIAHDELVADKIDRIVHRSAEELVDSLIVDSSLESGKAPNPNLLDHAMSVLSDGSNLEFLARLRQTGDQLRELRRILNRELEGT